MDLATVVGMVAGFIVIIICMVISGSLMMYWDGLSLLIVLGGAACSSMMRWPLENFIGGVGVGLKAIMSKIESPEELIEQIIGLAGKARKESILALEQETFENEFLGKCIKLAVDGTDEKMMEVIMADEIRAQKRRLNDGRGIFDDMAEACPAFGMIGTVIGLIVIMANLSDPSKIGPGLAVALITTLYGSLIANMVFIPIGKKLKFRVKEEVMNFEIIRLGVLGIVAGTNPNLMREQLNTYLS